MGCLPEVYTRDHTAICQWPKTTLEVPIASSFMRSTKVWKSIC
jgi:hypothetical protein